MSEEKLGLYVFTAPVRQTFPNLDEPKAVMKNGKPTGEPKYSNNFEFEPDSQDLKALKAKALAVAKAKWPGRNFAAEAAKVDENGNKKMPTFAFPFSNGDDLADAAKAKGKNREFSRGKAVLTARSKFQPQLSMLQAGKIIDIEGGDETKALVRKEFYNGAMTLGQVTFAAYDGVGNGADGVNAFLDKVLTLRKGERLSGGASAAETFKSYIGTESSYDPTAPADDGEIAF